MARDISSDDIRLVLESGLFDADWYREQYPDVAKLGMDAVEHYLWLGWRLGRDPGPNFSTQDYLDKNSNVASSGVNPLLHHIRHGRSRISLLAKRSPEQVANNESVGFSVIMPTKNRRYCIQKAVDSLISQTHRNFELIIVDDGSTDDTEEFIRRAYAKDIRGGRIVYIRLEQSQGVCSARNIGLSIAQKKWISYLDSDNTVRPNFLTVFADAIAKNPSALTFYANFQVNESGAIRGRPFNLKDLERNNYIDIGVFCHARDCYRNLGGFDPDLKRLVDWELILRYCKVHQPVHIPIVVMDYCNKDNPERITRRESYAKANVQVHRKHRVRDTVSIVVPCYNQEKYIKRALDSAIQQKGDFTFEIIVADDGSTDRTPEIIDEFCRKHPLSARNISSRYNMGISANFKRCFTEAAGEFVAVLEGDDYWESPENLVEKIGFLRKNADCSMVFSKLQMLFEKNGKPEVRYLDRQEKLKTNRLTGKHFIDDPDMNLIVNFSSCLFRADLLRKLPYEAYHIRLSEITVAFFMEKFGPIGYIDKPLTVYHHHGAGTWSGLSTPDKIRNAMEIRRIVKQIASPQYRDEIEKIIARKYVARLAEMEGAS